MRAAFERVLGRDPTKQEIERVKGFLAKYSATWAKAHSAAETKPQVTEISLKTDNSKTPGITDGIVRSDSLGQDDPDDTSKQFADETPPQVVPDSAQKAAWGAFVQSLYGSAEFQFAR
jgi:hypothetical protein